jgi:hypothetical protein
MTTGNAPPARHGSIAALDQEDLAFLGQDYRHPDSGPAEHPVPACFACPGLLAVHDNRLDRSAAGDAESGFDVVAHRAMAAGLTGLT